MQTDLSTTKMWSRLGRFIQVAGSGLVVAGSISATEAATRGLPTLSILSALAAAAGALCLAILRRLMREGAGAKAIPAQLQSHAAQIAPSLLALGLGVALLLVSPSPNVLLAVAPLVIWSWACAAGFLLSIRSQPGEERPRLSDTPEPADGRRALLALVLACSIVIMPSRIPGFLDGIPLDTPAEFLFVGLVLPLAFIAGRRTFARKILLRSMVVLLAAKIMLFLLVPQSGLGIRSYSNRSEVASGRWERGYDSLLHPGYTQVAQTPFLSLRQFPIEWINQPNFDEQSFWTELEISGTARLREGERLVFLVQKARLAQIYLIDGSTQSQIPALVVDQQRDLNAGLYQRAPALTEFAIRGTLEIRGLHQSRLEPLILSPAGSSQSALLSARLWADPNGSSYSPGQVSALRLIMDLIGLALIGIVSMALSAGILERYGAHYIAPIDLFLAASGLPVFFVAGLVPKPQMNILVIAVLGLFGAVKIIEAAIYPRKQLLVGLLYAIGMAFLVIFVALELDNLRSVAIFPQGQDGLEYQDFARSIWVKGDVFLLQTPPRAYKILFPYLVGSLHAIFGQSTSAQLFLNAWAALLSSVILAALLRTRVPAAIAFAAALGFLVIVSLPSSYIFYFRFGLIEPVAILLLLLTCYFAAQRRLWAMFTAGLLTVLLRLDYIGLAFGAVVLTGAPITGGLRVAWKLLFAWVRAHRGLLALYGLSLSMPPALIILGYAFGTPNYVLNALDTNQTSLASVADSLLRLIAAGNPSELRSKSAQDPTYLWLITLPLVLGFVVACASLLLRKGILKGVDMRFALLVPAILPTYIAVRPTGYLPRFSFSMLPFDLMVLALLTHCLVSGSGSTEGHSATFDYIRPEPGHPPQRTNSTAT